MCELRSRGAQGWTPLMARVKGFAPWNPQGKTLAMLDDVDAVLIEYREHLPLTIRQVFYRLVAKAYPKSERFYDSLQEAIGRARRSGRIAFADIRDDGVSRERRRNVRLRFAPRVLRGPRRTVQPL